MENFDVIVLGSGSAGQSAAYPVKEKGFRVAVVDNKPFGGTCANRGCDPKKVLVGGAEAVDTVKRYVEKGILQSYVKLDWTKLMEFKQSFVANVPKNTEEGLQQAGIKIYHGDAKFVGKTEIEVAGQRLSAKNIVIATGADPVRLNIPGEEFVTISDDFLLLTTLPKRIIFIGGGYISFEFAHIARRAGAEVIILHRSEKVLTGFDQDLVDLLVKTSRELGIQLELNAQVTTVEKTSAGLTARVKLASGEEKTFTADLVVHGGGRVPNVEKLNLEQAEVAYDKKGVKVNEYLQSISNPAIYAAGDAASYGLPLTPVAGKEGGIVAHNLLNADKKQAHFSEMPSVVFTIPPLATVGLREDQAKENGLEFEVKFEETSSWYSSRRINEKYSAYKTVVEKNTGRILGAHIFGHNAEDIINIFALAIAKNVTAQDIKDLIYSYPTRSSDIEYMV